MNIQELKNRISQADLTDREREVLELRYGLNGDRSFSIEEVGLYYNLEVEDMQKYIRKVLDKLPPSPSAVKKLEDYINF